MIHRADHHDVDILVVQDASVVLKCVNHERPLGRSVVINSNLECSAGLQRIHITDSNARTVLQRLFAVVSVIPDTGSNKCNPRLFIG